MQERAKLTAAQLLFCLELRINWPCAIHLARLTPDVSSGSVRPASSGPWWLSRYCTAKQTITDMYTRSSCTGSRYTYLYNHQGLGDWLSRAISCGLVVWISSRRAGIYCRIHTYQEWMDNRLWARFYHDLVRRVAELRSATITVVNGVLDLPIEHRGSMDNERLQS